MHRLWIISLSLLPALAVAHPGAECEADTTIVVDKVQVTAIKQGPVLRSLPIAATIVGHRDVERGDVDALKKLSDAVPNFHAPDYGSRMTSSIYVRGLGSRIEEPVVGLNIDNVPVMNKDAYDTETGDIERIEILRGPQSILYGRNTMGGVVNIYTLSPLTYEGIRLRAEYGSGHTFRFRASVYDRLNPDLGLSVSGFYMRSDGFFENLATQRLCDHEQQGGGRWKVQWRNRRGLKIDNTLSCSVLNQGGYPYAYIGEEIIRNGQTLIRPGEIRYNDPSEYRRTTLSNGFTLRYDAARFSLSSISAYALCDDCMTLDQDFLPLSYFTLQQARTEHTATQEIVVRSRDKGLYRWIVGAFGFYRHATMEAPVVFKETGIKELIVDMADRYAHEEVTIDHPEFPFDSRFRMPSAGGALYHESTLVAGGWRLAAGVRLDIEQARLHYRSATRYACRISQNTIEPFTSEGSLRKTFIELLPRLSALYAFDEDRNLYLSVSKGYKAGGFNTQIFSDVLQNALMERMGVFLQKNYDIDNAVSYRPEQSWNYELGGHFSCADGLVRGDFALFWIDCRNQQLTVFPPGLSTGRMMTNAGRTRSRGAEVSLRLLPVRNLTFDAAYGFTDARFVRFHDGQNDYAGNRIPYAPQHTLSAGITWTIPTGVEWLGDVVLRGGMRGAGSIEWNEANTRRQPFYALFDASVRLEQRRYALDLWCRNASGTRYDLFYFKSIGNEFVQRGRPRTMGITLSLNIN